MAGEVEQIKARLDIVDLISEYVQLKQSGTNWKAPCPFHNEKTPSFMVSRDKQIWHCFGCSEGGDIISFVQKSEGLEFIDALKILAQKAGVKLEGRDNQGSSQRSRLQDVCRAAIAYWQQLLQHDTFGKKARDYLKKRGLDEKTIAEFRIGYAAESWDALLKHLQGKNFSEQEIFLAGLLVKKDRGSGFYDRFRDRIIFPINDTHGNPVGFTGRTLKTDEDAGAKYINTPQTEIYNKSLVVFNLDKAKTDIRKADLAVLVEGQMDVISSYQAGVANVVAVSGTALTSEQVKLIRRFSQNLAIALDADAAGRKAIDRSTEVIRQTGAHDMNAKIIALPEGTDPDDYIRQSPEAWRKIISEAKSVMQYYFDIAVKENDLKTAEGKKEAAKMLLSLISKLGNRVEQTHWIQQLSNILNVAEQYLWESLPQAAPLEPQKPAAQQAEPTPQLPDLKQRLQEQILGIALKYPAQIQGLLKNVDAKLFNEGLTSQLYNSLKSYYTKNSQEKNKDFDYQKFHSTLSNEELKLLAHKLVLLTEKDFFDFDQAALAEEISISGRRLERETIKSSLDNIAQQINQAEDNQQQDKVDQLAKKFNKMSAQLQSLE